MKEQTVTNRIFSGTAHSNQKVEAIGRSSSTELGSELDWLLRVLTAVTNAEHCHITEVYS